jgi:hypothetical protein
VNDRANSMFPFAIAAVFPPAGLILALAEYGQGHRDAAGRIAGAAVLGAIIWVLLLTA